MEKQNKIILGFAAILCVGIVIYAVVNNNKNSSIGAGAKFGLYDQFAQCLTSKGATMYGAAWCSHCKEQKAAFGDSFKYINYVECPDNTKLCIDKGIQGFPTWLIGTSTKLEGFDSHTMKALSDATGCPLPQYNL